MYSNNSKNTPKLPRLYISAAKILREVKENGRSLKQEVYKLKHPNLKGIYGLVAKTLEHYSEIDTVIKDSKLDEIIRLDPWKARILVYEIIWRGKNFEYSQCLSIKNILSHRANLEKEKSLLDSNASKQAINQVEKPRYVRINTLKLSVDEAINGFRDEDWQLKRRLNNDYDEFLSEIASLESKEFMTDLHIKELLLFPPNTEFYKHEAYKMGSLILQDKASCLPVHILNPPPGSTVLDMCAAPGMKTSYLAALLNNEGTIYAVEREAARFQTLNKMVKDLGTTCIKTIHKDVLQVRENECPNVEYILVDPSCSGSGMTERLKTDGYIQKPDLNRLKRLSGFQVIILKHALLHFPQAKRVVYSTCSIHPEENEYVVSEVLKCNVNFALVSAKKLLNGMWRNASSSTDYEDISKYCISTTPEKDMTNGFFIAVFERINSDEHLNEDTQTTVKKKWKRSKVNAEAGALNNLSDTPKKHKKDKKRNIETDEASQLEEPQGSEKPKKKKAKKNKPALENHEDKQEEPQLEEASLKKTKKKKNKSNITIDLQDDEENRQKVSEINEASPKKKKSKKEKHLNNKDDENHQISQLEESSKKKKKKHLEGKHNISNNSLPEVKHKKIKKAETESSQDDTIRLEGFKDILNSSINTSIEGSANENSVLKKKNKKRKSKDLNLTGEDVENAVMKKHKKKN